MDGTRILIVGAKGQLGLALQAKYPNARAVDKDQLDISNAQAVANFNWDDVDIILNAAAYTKVDDAETFDGRITAWQVNAQAVGYLTRAAAQHDKLLVHVSSEYVFDGRQTPHKEDEAFSPLGVYGQTKAAGDIVVSTAPKHYILRTSWLIGEGHNFVRTMAGLASKGVSPTVVHDQIGRLTFTTTLVDAIDHLLLSRPAFGVYNVSNDGHPASWADVTRAVFTLLNKTGLTVTNTTTEEYFAGKPGVSPRPLQSSLDLAKIKATGLRLRDWQDDLRRYIQETV